MSDRATGIHCPGCAAALPEGALFCAECGRSVVHSASAPATPAEQCDRCGAAISPDDIFCGECGHVAGSIIRAYAAGRDTVVIEPVAPAEVRGRLDADDLRMPDPVRSPDDVRSSLSERIRRPRERHRADPDDRASFVAEDPDGPDRPSVPDGADRANGRDSPDRASRRDSPDRRAVRTDRDRHDRPDAEEDHADVEATRIVPPRGRGDRFVLQFSTGESITVYGSGLIGRNPVPEPGEYFDQIVRVFDPTRSVSKTHLEFGQDAGSFWVRDRYSGNGTVVREPDTRPRRCDPGKRYPVMRGGRIDLGEQFLVVS